MVIREIYIMLTVKNPFYSKEAIAVYLSLTPILGRSLVIAMLLS